MKYMFLILLSTNVYASDITEIIKKTEKKYNIFPGLIQAMVDVESNGRPHVINHNDGNSDQKAKGLKVKSYGLMQIQVAAARDVGFTGKPNELMVPATNIEYGARYLKKYLDIYKDDVSRALTCYNAGYRACRQNAYSRYVGLVLNAYIKRNF